MEPEPTDKRTFTYEEALESFPAVRERTERAIRQIQGLVGRFGSREEIDERRDEVEVACQQIVEGWVQDVRGEGCEVKGLWLVDWDSGHGYYCWRYPEEALCHFHGYDEGFAGRVPIN